MRRRVFGLFIASLLVGSLTTTEATQKRKNVTPPSHPGVVSVTDSMGNPVPLQQHAVNNTQAAPTRATDTEIQRGQDWWPYGASLPPYTSVNRRAESLSETEIQVNGVAVVDTRDVEAAFRVMPKDLKLEPDQQLARTDGFYLVKIAGFSRTQEQIDALTQAGATLGEYLNINTYIARIPASSLTAVRSLPFVTYVGDYQPAYKISPRIGLEPIPVEEAVDPISGEAKPWLFEVILHKGAYVPEVLDDLARIGIFPAEGDVQTNDEMTVLLLRTAPTAVPAIAGVPGVKWIAEKTFPRLLASSTNPAMIPMVLQNNGVYTTSKPTGWKLWNAGIDGTATGQIVTMMDSGLNSKMFHFSQDTVNHGTIGAAHRKVVGYDVYGSGDVCVLDNSSGDGGHGAKTSQHALGSISNMTSNPDGTHTPPENWDNGIARGAKLYFQDIGTPAGTIGPPGDLGPSIAAAIAKGSFVQNHSWGAATNAYDASSSNLDTALFNNPNMVVTVSAGNRGAAGIQTLGSPSTAKNAICVGGNDASSANSLFIDCNYNPPVTCGLEDLGSSRGPVSGNGRTKPDIMGFIFSNVAIGGEQFAYNSPTAMCQSDATKTPYWNYQNIPALLEGGTSFSAPQLAGLAAVTRDYFMQGFYPTGTATPGNAITPRGSLVKAILLASGEDMNTTSAPSSFPIVKRYSSDVGYGRANLPGVLHIGSGAPFLWVQNGDSLGQSATKSFTYNINGNAIPLRVMMVYYDTAGDALQKDADLRVTVNGSTIYWGNNFNAGWSTSTTSTRDHTNNTEGVFLDAAHGLPAAGTVVVDVIGFNNPGGMNYSLVVSGNVASSAVQQVSLDQGTYTCNDTIGITVNDSAATSPVSVTLVSKNAATTTIDTEVISCPGAGGVFTCSIQTGSGITVADGGSVTATYSAAPTASALIACQADLSDAGFLISGGCDNDAAGTNQTTGPLFNGGVNEFYTKYMDAGEYTSYKMAFVNDTGTTLTDVTVALSFSGAGASKMSALNGPIHIGVVPAGSTAGGVFQLYTDPSAAGSPFPTTVDLNFAVTSPGDGFTTASPFTHTHLLHANDTVQRQNRCSTFNTTIAPWVESVRTACTVPPCTTNPWRWTGVATAPATIGSENRTDGLCGNATANAGAIVGNSGIASNFTAKADSVMLQNFQPALTGNAPNGQPYRFAWKWHSFYHAAETVGATTGVWGAFYNHQWNNPANPTGDQAVDTFPIAVAHYYQTVFDYPANTPGTSWNWETANTGTPDVPAAPVPAPNQLIITFNGVTGVATPTTFFAYGHEHGDVASFGAGASTAATRRDISLDNDNLVYDEFFGTQQAAACTPGSQVGQVAFDQVAYGRCNGDTTVISVVDANGVSGLQVTVTSAGTGDSELVTLTGSAPYFSASLSLSSLTGIGNNNGTLFVLPVDTLNATYSDGSPVGSTNAVAATACGAGDVQYVANVQILDNGDNDGIPDNNECVTLDLTIKNNSASPLTNTKVTIVSNNSNIDLIPDDHAYYGTVGAGATVVNPAGDRFRIHVNPAVACSVPANPPVASFTVIITADGVDGAVALQTFQMNLDLDIGGGTTTYTQNFAADPGWTVGTTAPENSGCSTNAYTNDFHWCGACGNAGAGYGAWVGNSAFGTGAQNYTSAFNSSTLYSPVFTAAGATSLQFRTAYRTETTWDGAIVQYQLGAGAWTNLGFSTPAQAATTAGNACSPIAASTIAWTGNGVSWTLTNAAPVPSSNGQSLQFRWRLGGDQSVAGATFGGFGVDDVSVTGLRQFLCEPTDNPNAACCLAPGLLVNNTAADVNLCVNGGVQITWPQNPDLWGDGGAGTRTYDVLRNGSPIATGIAYGTTTYNDATAVAGVTYLYTVRYNNGCGGQTTTTGSSKADSNNVTCTASDQCHAVGVCAPATGVCTNPAQPDGTPCNDGSPCSTGESCTAGSCVGGTPNTPTEIQNARVASDKTTLLWDSVPNSPTYDVLRGEISALPVGPGSGDEFCFNGVGVSLLNDATLPGLGQGFWYLIRAETTCGVGTYGTQKDLTPRISTTCP